MTKKSVWDDVSTVGELKEILKDLPNDLPIECEVHGLGNTYCLKTVYRCGNAVGEPILCFGIKTDWELTERDKLALKKFLDENG